MNRFTPIPLIADYSISSSGRIMPNGISVKSIDSVDYLAVGTLDGELL